MARNLMGLDFNVDENAIGEVVKKVVQSSIIESLGAKEQLVEQAVRTMITAKVDKNGNITNRDYDKVGTLIDFHVQKITTDLCKELVKEMIEEKRDDLRKELKKQLNSQRSIDAFVKSMIDNTVGSLENRWNPGIKVYFNEKEDDY